MELLDLLIRYIPEVESMKYFLTLVFILHFQPLFNG
jgi:hypothetical protein